jgi:hypothetical protein
MIDRNRKSRRAAGHRGQPGSAHDPPKAKARRMRLPVHTSLSLDDSLPANNHLPLAQSAAELFASSRLRPIDGVSQGDCFVVVNGRGECWDGARWVALWSDAVQFRRPDPAYEFCEAATREAKELTGEAGMVCYIPPGTPASFVLAPIPDLSQVDLRDFARKPEVC